MTEANKQATGTIVAASSLVKPGYYFDIRQLHLVALRAGESLPGSRQGRYRRVPAPLAVPLAITLGATFVFFLPIVGFVLVFQQIAKTLFRRGQ
jgi:hypothetical protein